LPWLFGLAGFHLPKAKEREFASSQVKSGASNYGYFDFGFPKDFGGISILVP